MDKIQIAEEYVKIYEELKKQAYDSILNSIVVADNNLLNLKMIRYKDWHSFGEEARYSFKLNDATFEGNIRIDPIYGWNRLNVFEKLYKELGEHISKELMKALLKDEEYKKE